MRGHDACHCVEDPVDPARVLALPGAQHPADANSLQVLLAAAQVARNDRELALLGPAREVALRDVGHRADDDVLAVVADELGRHRAQRAAEEHVHHERLGEIVEVVAERDLGGAELGGEAVEHAATQARAQAAHRPAFGNEALDDRVVVRVYQGSVRSPDVWESVIEWKKDCWPMKFFQYGNAFFPDGNNTTSCLAVTSIAVESDDLVTSLYSIRS